MRMSLLALIIFLLFEVSASPDKEGEVSNRDKVDYGQVAQSDTSPFEVLFQACSNLNRSVRPKSNLVARLTVCEEALSIFGPSLHQGGEQLKNIMEMLLKPIEKAPPSFNILKKILCYRHFRSTGALSSVPLIRDIYPQEWLRILFQGVQDLNSYRELKDYCEEELLWYFAFDDIFQSHYKYENWIASLHDFDNEELQTELVRKLSDRLSSGILIEAFYEALEQEQTMLFKSCAYILFSFHRPKFQIIVTRVLVPIFKLYIEAAIPSKHPSQVIDTSFEDANQVLHLMKWLPVLQNMKPLNTIKSQNFYNQNNKTLLGKFNERIFVNNNNGIDENIFVKIDEDISTPVPGNNNDIYETKRWERFIQKARDLLAPLSSSKHVKNNSSIDSSSLNRINLSLPLEQKNDQEMLKLETSLRKFKLNHDSLKEDTYPVDMLVVPDDDEEEDAFSQFSAIYNYLINNEDGEHKGIFACLLPLFLWEEPTTESVDCLKNIPYLQVRLVLVDYLFTLTEQFSSLKTRRLNWILNLTVNEDDYLIDVIESALQLKCNHVLRYLVQRIFKSKETLNLDAVLRYFSEYYRIDLIEYTKQGN